MERVISLFTVYTTFEFVVFVRKGCVQEMIVIFFNCELNVSMVVVQLFEWAMWFILFTLIY